MSELVAAKIREVLMIVMMIMIMMIREVMEGDVKTFLVTEMEKRIPNISSIVN